MKQIKATTDHLLEPALGSLHKETVAWQQQIALWADQFRFLFHRLRKAVPAGTSPSLEQANAEQELVRLNSERLTQLKTSVHSHEKHLAACSANGSDADERVYRETHEKIRSELAAFDHDFRKYKKEVLMESLADEKDEPGVLLITDPATEADL